MSASDFCVPQPFPQLPPQPIPGNDISDKLIVCSYPSGQKVYVVPKEKIQYGISSDVMFNLENKEFLMGTTPLFIKIAPGTFRVTVVWDNKDNPVKFWGDGEDFSFEHLAPDGTKFFPYAKSYLLTKQAGHSPVITAVFWTQDKSLHDFVAGMKSDTKVFPNVNKQSIEKTLREYNVPLENWNDLETMMQRIGKLIWHGKGPEQFVYVSFIELSPQTQIAVSPAILSSPAANEAMPAQLNGADQITRPKTSLSVPTGAIAKAPLRIHIAAGLDDYFIKLVPVDASQQVITGYIRAGETLDADVPLGDFHLKYAVDPTWLGPSDLFGPKTLYFLADSILSFKRTAAGYSGQEVTLVLLVAGNMQVDTVSAREF